MNKQIKEYDKTGVAMSAASSATMIGFSATIITLIVTLVDKSEYFCSLAYILIFYMLAIIFFIFSTEFFILASWDYENYLTWSGIGSLIYSFGLGWIIIGISLTFDILVNLNLFAYLTLTLFFVALIIYHLIRKRIIKKEPSYNKERTVVRIFTGLQLFIGYLAMILLE